MPLWSGCWNLLLSYFFILPHARVDERSLLSRPSTTCLLSMITTPQGTPLCTEQTLKCAPPFLRATSVLDDAGADVPLTPAWACTQVLSPCRSSSRTATYRAHRSPASVTATVSGEAADETALRATQEDGT